MPQIAQLAATYASQVFWMLVVFALIYFGIGKAMLPKITATMDAREARISGDLRAAEAASVTAPTIHRARIASGTAALPNDRASVAGVAA